MRKFLLLLLACAVVFSCNNNKNDTKSDTSNSKEKVESSNTSTSPIVNLVEKILGSFVGAFGNNKITMLITKAQGDSIAGRTIVGGNDRPFIGTFHKDGEKYLINAKEPGDDKDDGEFNFEISENNPEVVTGSWKPYDKNRPAKEYSLQRKKFEYKPDVGDYPEASQRLLKPKDVENMMKEDLEFMRNEIFARHGFCFKKKNLRQQFEMQDWYVPNTTDIKGFLTETEKKNIELIKRYEKYADEYGDEYGR